jgi:hypothetical protein
MNDACDFLALVAGHLAVVALDGNLAVAQGHVQIVHRTNRRAVHDARPSQTLDELAEHAQLVRLARHLAHVEGQVRPVERHAADVGVLHAELDENVLGDGRRRGGGQAQDGRSPSTSEARRRPR